MGKVLRIVERKEGEDFPLKEEESKQEEIRKGNGEGQQMDATHYCQLGQGYMEKGEFFKAIAKLEEAIALDPSCVDACLRIGHCYEKLKKYEKALAYYEKALKLDPSRVEIRYSLGVSLQLLAFYTPYFTVRKQNYLPLSEVSNSY